MESISLKTSSPIMAMTTAAVKVLLKFLTSLKVNSWLAAAAIIALCCSLISDTRNPWTVTLIVAWVTHFAAMSAIDIHRKGGEL